MPITNDVLAERIDNVREVVERMDAKFDTLQKQVGSHEERIIKNDARESVAPWKLATTSMASILAGVIGTWLIKLV